MKTLTELIQNYQNGIPDSDSEILKRMEPLVKGYASRIHCMEREDSTQELYLTLLKTLPYLSSSSSEGECIRYMQTLSKTDIVPFAAVVFPNLKKMILILVLFHYRLPTVLMTPIMM